MNEDRERDDTVALLLRRFEPRPALPPERAARLKAAVRPRWQQEVRVRARRRRVRWTGAVLAAAALVLLAFGLVLRRESPAAAVQVASLETGAVHLTDRALAIGEAIHTGDRVETRSGRAALRLTGGSSLRLDTGTRVRFESPSAFDLEQGAVYVDSRSPAVEIHTPAGTVREIGTQFEVRLTPAGTLRMRVREGSIVLEGQDGSHEVGAGEEMIVAADGTMERHPVPLHGSTWEWVLEIAPPFEIDGKTIHAFLEWVARETGWELRYADDAVRVSAAQELLFGSLEGLSADQAPDVFLPATGLVHRLEDGTLIIASR